MFVSSLHLRRPFFLSVLLKGFGQVDIGFRSFSFVPLFSFTVVLLLSVLVEVIGQVDSSVESSLHTCLSFIFHADLVPVYLRLKVKFRVYAITTRDLSTPLRRIDP